MGNLFYAAANAIVAKFDERMQRHSWQSATLQMQTAATHLEDLAGAARYAGDSETARALEATAYHWRFNGIKPRPFRGC
ncbi:hypothetical protein Z042_01460 [Chania multitudinisentens RB-25]|uniref:Uncharacterized protein n=1 Tax=Chania multitudinisentens RB-25 TaxID=1441930 RepID=W0LKQ7_9GAMM|nr:hypothetical protein [Chania multitudinisentens]AHG22575.1 hypothetical protein Z042_01460 [Chania multitudinisentens RB-25]